MGAYGPADALICDAREDLSCRAICAFDERIHNLSPLSRERKVPSKLQLIDMQIIFLLSTRLLMASPRRDTTSVAHLIRHRRFSTTSICHESEPRFTVNGVTCTKSQVLSMRPVDRTIDHWAVIVDWTLQASKPYVVVDPFDPNGLLYLSSSEYLLQARVCANNNLHLLVVARPGSKEPVLVSPSSKFPPSWEVNFDADSFFSYRANRLTWREVAGLRAFARRSVKVENGMVTVSATSVGKTVLLWGTSLLHYAGVARPGRRLALLTLFTVFVRHTLKHNGPQFLIQKLKIALFCIYSYVSGNPLSSTQALGLRTRLAKGLPVWIPRNIRDQIRAGNLRWIRIWVSLCNIYRALGAKAPDPETAYATIRAKGPDLSQNPMFKQWEHFCKEVFPALVKSRSSLTGVPLRPYKYLSNLHMLIPSAAVNLKGTCSNMSMILDAQAWERLPENLPLQWFLFNGDLLSARSMTFAARARHTPCSQNFDEQESTELMNEVFGWSHGMNPTPDAKENAKRRSATSRKLQEAGYFAGQFADAWRLANEVRSLTEPITGRLFNFVAPGAKLRTVAICDYWTQIGLKSVHDHLFSILKIFVGNDATFDQQGVVKKYFDRNWSPHWSYDLKAATDTIPISLYIPLLAPFLISKGESASKGRDRAALWARVMTEREFSIPSPKKGEEGHDGTRQYRSIRYNTGQPMGAYSSWASLALMHHALVQFSYWRSSDTLSSNWFSQYLVLGDDVDIAASRRVADSYRESCSNFNITIGLAKSFQSRVNFFEFANRRYCPKGDISPISMTEEVSSTTWSKRQEYANAILERFGYSQESVSDRLRVTLTPRQWQYVLPEFTGKRSPVLLRLLQFILRSPLLSAEGDLRIVNILKWLSGLAAWAKPLGDTPVDKLSHIEANLLKRIVSLIETEISKRLPSAQRRYMMRQSEWAGSSDPKDSYSPEMVSTWIPLSGGQAATDGSYELRCLDPIHLIYANSRNENPLRAGAIWDSVIVPETRKERLSTRVGSSWACIDRIVPNPMPPHSEGFKIPSLARYPILILLYAVNTHNAIVERNLLDLKDRMDRAIGAKTFGMRAAFLDLFGEENMSALGEGLAFFNELSRMPAAITLPETAPYSFKSCLAGTVKPDLSREYAHRLLVEILIAIAEEEGETVMSFPFDAFRGMRGGLVRRLLASVKRSWVGRSKPANIVVKPIDELLSNPSTDQPVKPEA